LTSNCHADHFQKKEKKLISNLSAVAKIINLSNQRNFPFSVFIFVHFQVELIYLIRDVNLEISITAKKKIC